MFTPLLRTLMIFGITASLFCKIPAASALTPDEIVVVANSRATDSVKLAKYYMQKRAIPQENLIKIRTTWDEVCDREDYDKNIAAPVREAITKLRTTKLIRGIVTMYGVPLKIRPPTLDFEEEDEVEKLRRQIQQYQQTLKTSEQEDQPEFKDQIKSLRSRIEQILQTNLRASVDSELALVLTRGLSA